MLEALLVSTAVVALGELGDKTQLLALVLAARYRKPWPIVAGIFVATLVNHAIAGWVGNWVRGVVPADVLRWLLALSFFAVAAWALKPDKLDDDDAPPASRMGRVRRHRRRVLPGRDRRQDADRDGDARREIRVACRPSSLGTTLGMLIVNVPTVFIGRAASERIPFRAVRIAAAALFAALGVWVLLAPHVADEPNAAGIIKGLSNRRHEALQSSRNRSRRAGRVARGRRLSRHRARRPAQVLLRVDAAVSVGRAAHGARAQLHDQRHDVPAAADARIQPADADGLGRVRPARRKRRDEEPRRPRQVDAREHRDR